MVGFHAVGTIAGVETIVGTRRMMVPVVQMRRGIADLGVKKPKLEPNLFGGGELF